MPNLGSGSVMEWPPRTATPAFGAASTPPCSTLDSMRQRAGRRPATRRCSTRGTACRPSRRHRDIAFVAAMRPQSYGSSTIGVKKSRVAMMARSSSSAPDRGVVAGVDAHQHLGWHIREPQRPDDLEQLVGAELAPASGAVAERGEPAFRPACPQAYGWWETPPMEIAVVGHTEWIRFADVDAVPPAGEHRAHDGTIGKRREAAVPSPPCSSRSSPARRLLHRDRRRRVRRSDRDGADGTGRRRPRRHATRHTEPARAHLGRPRRRTHDHHAGRPAGPAAADPLPWDDLAGADAVYVTAGDAGAFAHARRASHMVVTSRVLHESARHRRGPRRPGGERAGPGERVEIDALPGVHA